MIWLAHCFRFGYGVDKDERKSFQLASDAADTGNQNAQAALASYFRSGNGTERDEMRGDALLYGLSASGNAFASMELDGGLGEVDQHSFTIPPNPISGGELKSAELSVCAMVTVAAILIQKEAAVIVGVARIDVLRMPESHRAMLAAAQDKAHSRKTHETARLDAWSGIVPARKDGRSKDKITQTLVAFENDASFF